MVLQLAEQESVLVVLLLAELESRLVALHYLEVSECFCKEIPCVRGCGCIWEASGTSGDTRDRGWMGGRL